MKYLARYVKRVAISDARILRVDDHSVTFRTKTGQVTLDGPEFVRRFALHILPGRFRKVRHAGLYAPRPTRERLERARALAPTEVDPAKIDSAEEPTEARELRGSTCPACGETRIRRIFRCAEPTPLPVARGPP